MTVLRRTQALLSAFALLAGMGPEVSFARDLKAELFDAARSGEPASIASVLDAGADPNSRYALGTTPLHFLAHGGRAEAITTLVERGAVVNARTTYGLTPLHHAAGAGATRAIVALCAAKADPNLRNHPPAKNDVVGETLGVSIGADGIFPWWTR